MRATVAMALLSLLAPLLVPSFPTVAGLQAVPASLVGTPSEIAYAAVVAKLASGNQYREKEGGDLYFVKDQMTAVLLLLNRSARLPDDRALLVGRATDVWTSTEPGYSAPNEYYSVTLNSPSICIDLVTNAWALRAARALAQARGEDLYAARAATLARTLTDLLTGGIHRQTSFCPYDPARPNDAGRPLDLAQVPLALLALLEEYQRQPDPALRSTLLATIDQQRRDHFDTAFHDASQLYSPVTNAQLLLVLDQATTILGNPDYAKTRDAVAQFLTERSLDRAPDGPWAMTVVRNPNGTLERVGEPDPVSQWWVAYALHNHNFAAPGSVPPTLVDELVSDVQARFWSYDRGGFVARGSRGDGLIHFEANALPAYLLAGPLVTAVQPGDAEVRIVVPQRGGFTYPPLSNATQPQYYLRNKWDFRFGVAVPAAGTYRVILPTAPLGGLNTSFAETEYTRVPVLQAGSQTVPGSLRGGADPILEFNAVLERGTSAYRLSAYAPVLPRSAAVTDSLRVVLHSYATAPIHFSSLYLEADVSQVDFLGATLNDAALEPSQVVLEGPLTTQPLPDAHLGIDLRRVTLRPGADNEVVIRFKDVTSPTVSSLRLSGDEAGRDLLREQDGSYRLSGQETTYVRAVVRDNLALRQVYLHATNPRDPTNATEVRLNPTANDPTLYVGTLPRFRQSGESLLQVVAVDYQGNQNPRGEPVRIRVQSSLLGDSPILFVFSLTLLVAAVVIYVKMGRRQNDH